MRRSRHGNTGLRLNDKVDDTDDDKYATERVATSDGHNSDFMRRCGIIAAGPH